MTNRLQTLFVLLTCLLLGGCATYNATVPEWAQIASESTGTTTEDDASELENAASWWNLTNWF
ncbi:hypothetical protein N8005_02435 [Litorivicinus sp.]|jgi:hypothetical protein|nr:hypothetical protein [Litorivicinus sp.]